MALHMPGGGLPSSPFHIELAPKESRSPRINFRRAPQTRRVKPARER